MNGLVYLLFYALFLFGFAQMLLPMIPKYVMWIPDVLALYCAVLVCLRLALNAKRWVQHKYLCFVFLYTFVIIIGVLINKMTMGTILLGARIYFRYIPFFFLPLVCNLSESDFLKQLRFLFVLLILQFPVAVGQKIYFRYLAHHYQTGDVICGTVLSSGVLSILLLCSIAVLFAFYLKNYINFKFFSVAALCMFFPTTINETKVTFFLIPLAFLIPIFFYKGYSIAEKYRKLLKMLILCTVLVTLFVPIYNVIKPDIAPGILNYVENSNKLKEYLYAGEENVNKGGKPRRMDTIIIAYTNMINDWQHFLFGYGMGNLTSSTSLGLSSSLYNEKSSGNPESLAITNLFWEVGIVGVVLYIAFFILVYRSARLLNKSGTVFGAFALGWSAVVPIMGIALIYLNPMKSSVLGYCFWYFSGVVASKAYQLRIFMEQRDLARSFHYFIPQDLRSRESHGAVRVVKDY